MLPDIFQKVEARCLRKIAGSNIPVNGKCLVARMPNGLWYMFHPKTKLCVETDLINNKDFKLLGETD